MPAMARRSKPSAEAGGFLALSILICRAISAALG
jgi:hypothetical protein